VPVSAGELDFRGHGGLPRDRQRGAAIVVFARKEGDVADHVGRERAVLALLPALGARKTDEMRRVRNRVEAVAALPPAEAGRVHEGEVNGVVAVGTGEGGHPSRVNQTRARAYGVAG